MDQTTSENVSLDDSLTSIQWLCQLESNKLLKSNSHKKRESLNSHQVDPPKEEYNPFQKPQYSYASLIVMAINTTRDKRMTLQSIYTWIEENFPYYQYAKKGWKNSIRHNLSLHKFFIKEQRTDVLCGKGSYWRISPEGKENLMRNLLKPPVCNLKPPIALLPHDPNRKLRPILPKPGPNETRLQYVPLVDYNLPIVLVPAVNEAKNQIHNDPTRIVPAQMQGNCYASPFEQGSASGTPTTATKSEVIDSSSKSMLLQSVECKTLNTPPAIRTSLFEQTPSRGEHSAKRRIKAKDVPSKQHRPRVSTNSKRVPNILRRKTKAPVKSPKKQHKAMLKTPLKNSVQSTLAAINSCNHTPSSPKRPVDDPVNGLTALDSSPFGHNRSFDFLQYSFSSPGISPLRSPVRFSSGFTPLGQGEREPSNVSTPSTSFLADLSFNWTPTKSGLTPMSSSISQSSSSSAPQRCRKALGLE